MTRQDKIGITKSTSDTCKLVQVNSSFLIFKTHNQVSAKEVSNHHQALSSKNFVEIESTKSNNKFVQRSINKTRQQQKEFTAQIITQRPVRRNTVLQHRLSKDLSALLPLIKKNCPISLQLDNPRASKGIQENCVKLSTNPLLPPPRPYLSTNQLRHQIKKQKVEYSPILPIASSTQLIPRSRRSDRNSQSQNKFSTSSENLNFPEENSLPKNLCCSDVGQKTSFHFISHERQPFNLKQNLTFRDLSPIISCGGKIGFGIPAKLSTPSIVNLSVEANPNKRNPTSLFSDWSALARMGVKTAPCSQQASISNTSTDSGVSVRTRPSHSSVGSDCASLRCRESMTSPSEQISQLETGPPKALVSEHHSFVNLPSSFNIPIANLGYMTVPGGKGVRSSKSFHGDGTDKPVHIPTTSNQHGNLVAGSPLRQQQHHRKMLERQRIKMLKPLSVNKNHGAMSKISEFSASVLPDPTTSSYRLTNDVSFDEGSRYNSGTGVAYAVETRKDQPQRPKHNLNQTEALSSAYAGNARLEKLVDSPNRDRSSHVTPHKEAMPMSLVRIEERLNFESPLGRHPPHGSFAAPPGSRGQSAQGGNPSPSAPGNPLTTFRLHKGRQSWNYKMGDLSVNGGGYYGCSPLQPGGRIESTGIGSLSISPASNFSSKMGTRARERNGSVVKSRMSSRYGCRMDSGFNSSSTRECQYSDPCQSAPPSFQQRLIELSVLESDTIKYERSRKLKRKKNLDS